MKLQVVGTGSKGNCYILSHEGKQLLLDAGLTYRELMQALGFDLSGLQAALITHEHQDHCKAAAKLAEAAVPIFMSEGTSKAIFGDVMPFSVEVIAAVITYGIAEGWQIMPFKVEHDAADPFGFVLANGDHRILYLTDSYYCKYKFAGLTHIIIECNFVDSELDKRRSSGELNDALYLRLKKSHFSLDRVIQFLGSNDLSRVQKIVLVHLSDSHSDEKVMIDQISSRFNIPVVAANKGMIVDFDLCPF